MKRNFILITMGTALLMGSLFSCTGNKAQGNAYIWMIIQPFISIDQFSLATMTPQERSNFEYIISNLPRSKRFAQIFDIKQRELNYLLPQQLLKIYVLSL